MNFSLSFALLFLLSFSGFTQNMDWRFGFEYNEYEPPLFGVSEASHDTLLSKLTQITTAQATPGGININWGGWMQLQPEENSNYLFAEIADPWVARFQQYGFSLVVNLTSTAEWAFDNNPDCIQDMAAVEVIECAPDEEHWQDWYDFVKAFVERYNGDGENDMPGLQVPIRYYVMDQEIYFAGDGEGDAGEATGSGFWEDNMQNLIELHRVAYAAMRAADPDGNVKLVGSGGLLFDLYGDFPDYPNTYGPTVQSRLAGNNLNNSIYTSGWDSLIYLIQRLGDDTGGVKCDYIGWHPHLGWKATDQSMKLIREHAPDKPIFIDDMWSSILTTHPPLTTNGFTQFIGGDSIEGDFPNMTVSSYQQLLNGLTNDVPEVVDWYNAKTAREAVKCFAAAFGEGAEKVSFSMTNDLNKMHPLFPFSWPWRYSGLHGNVGNNYANKPVAYTMKVLVEKLHDFTSVEQIYEGILTDPYTRVYKFERARGTACYIAWSESGWNTETPELPNGTTVQIPVISTVLDLTNIITQPEEQIPTVEEILPENNLISIQLGFKPVIIEERITTEVSGKYPLPVVNVYPNPATDMLYFSFSSWLPGMELQLINSLGQAIHQISSVNQQESISTKSYPDGIYWYQIILDSKKIHDGKVIIQHP